MTEVKTLDLGRHDTGYEWRAGETPPGDSTPGYWMVRKDQTRWTVLFRSQSGAEYFIYTFSLADDREKLAKEMAVKLVDFAWGRYYE